MSSFVPIYAVDFDGTLCESKWPGIGAPNKKTDTAPRSTQSRGRKSDPLDLQSGRTSERGGGLVR